MAYQERIDIYHQIEELRKRPLVVYVTSLRANAGGQMAQDVIPEIARQLQSIEENHVAIDLLLISNGGDPTVAWRIVSLIRESFSEFSTLLPYAAYSAATLIAMGADRILMHQFSNLGPVDPQLTSTRSGNGKPQVSSFGSEDLVHFLSFVREDVGISDQEQLQRSFELLCKDVGAVNVGAAKRSAQLSLSLGERLLSLHIEDQNEAKAIAEALSKSYFHHGYPVGRKEAINIGLPVEDPGEELEQLLWRIWEDFEGEMLCNVPFNPLTILRDEGDIAPLLSAVQQIQIPSNLPPAIMQQAYNQVLQQIQILEVNPVEYELLHASVESVRCRSEFRTEGVVSAQRLPDLQINAAFTPVSQGWTFDRQ